MGVLFLLDSKGSGGSFLFLNKILGSKDRVKAYMGIKEHIGSIVTAKEYTATTIASYKEQ